LALRIASLSSLPDVSASEEKIFESLDIRIGEG
jgi:hypothetical protein